jgi:WD40 repeat protein
LPAKQASWQLAPRHRRLLLAALLLAALLLAGVVYRIQTDKGELVITTESDDVEVVIKQSGKQVDVIDTKTKKSITLRSGVYELELKDAPKGLKLDVEKATLKRGEKTLATIERVPKPSPAKSTPEKALEVFRQGRDVIPVTSGVDLSPDGRLLLSMHWGEVRVWDVSSGKVVHKWEGWLGQFTPDGKKIVTTAPPDPAGNDLRLYDTDSGELLRKFGRHPTGHEYLRMSGDGLTVVTGDPKHVLRLWDFTTGDLLHSWGPNEQGPGSVYTWGLKEVDVFVNRTGVAVQYVLPGGREVMGPPEGRAFPIYEVTSGRRVRTASLEGTRPIDHFDNKPGRGTRLPIALPDGTICVLDLFSGKEVARFSPANFPPKCLAISADGRFVAACASNEKSDLVVWRLPDSPAKDKP